MASRSANENRFKQWKAIANNGRHYFRRVAGKQGWHAVYCKEVDADEKTLRIWQEVYNEKNELVEIHHKYPEDSGHQKIK